MSGSTIETKWDDEDRKSAITEMLAQELQLPAYPINHFGMRVYIAYFALTMHLLLIVSNSGGSRLYPGLALIPILNISLPIFRELIGLWPVEREEV